MRFSGPLATLEGREPVVEAANRLSAMLRGITFRGQFAAGEKVMLAYEMDMPDPIGRQQAATLMTFRDGLIAELQLYYDPRPYERAMGKGAVFSR